MAELPSELLARLDADDAAACSRSIDAIGEELAAVYAANVNDHREARGDNAVLFGLKVWVHGDFRITGRLEDDERANVVHSNGSYSVRIGPLAIGVYKLGDTADEDIHECFPDASPTKRSYAERNRAQLTIFDLEPNSPLPPTARYALDDLLIGHFGNPREGLVRWYVGAPMTDERGVRRWAWIARQPLPVLGAASDPARPVMTSFDSREPEPLVVRPRSRQQAS